MFSMRGEWFPVGTPAKPYSPAVSVRALRFNPVPWLTIVTLTLGTGAWVGDGAGNSRKLVLRLRTY